jgi:hypothetical protein
MQVFAVLHCKQQWHVAAMQPPRHGSTAPPTPHAQHFSGADGGAPSLRFSGFGATERRTASNTHPGNSLPPTIWHLRPASEARESHRPQPGHCQGRPGPCSVRTTQQVQRCQQRHRTLRHTRPKQPRSTYRLGPRPPQWPSHNSPQCNEAPAASPEYTTATSSAPAGGELNAAYVPANTPLYAATTPLPSTLPTQTPPRRCAR